METYVPPSRSHQGTAAYSALWISQVSQDLYEFIHNKPTCYMVSIRVSSRVRTHDPSVWAGEVRGHCDRFEAECMYKIGKCWKEQWINDENNLHLNKGGWSHSQASHLNLVSNIKNKISIETTAEYRRSGYVWGVRTGFAGKHDLVATLQSMCVWVGHIWWTVVPKCTLHVFKKRTVNIRQ
jgi:hypothetical protein